METKLLSYKRKMKKISTHIAHFFITYKIANSLLQINKLTAYQGQSESLNQNWSSFWPAAFASWLLQK